MRKSLGPAMGLSLALLLLAGCAGADARGPAPAPGQEGRIEGVVVTAAIAPLEGVTVALVPGGRIAASDAAGRFAFDGVADGDHVLTATHPGYIASQTTVRVRSGAADPPLAQLVLDADTLLSPYVESYVYQGYLEVSFRLGPTAGSGGGLLADPAIGTGYTLASRLPAWVQAEMVWTPTQAMSASMLLTATPQNGSTVQTIGVEAEGPSPLLLAFDTAVLEEWGMQGGQPLGISAFVGNNTPEPAPAVGFALAQPFEVFTHLFYGYRPPEGWRLTAEGQPPPPPA